MNNHLEKYAIKEILNYLYFYFTFPLGSSSWITDVSGAADRHIQNLAFGEDYIYQRNSSWDVPYTFSGKEKDVETGYSYFGARYYDSDISVWLSVDPLADKYPSMSAYMYTAGNPVMLVDPDGRKFKPTNPEAKELFNKLIDKFGRQMFHLKSEEETKYFEIEDKYRLKDFKKELKKSGYKKDSEEYKEAIKLFKMIKSDKIFELTVISTETSTQSLEGFSIRTRNDHVDEFRNKYVVDKDGSIIKTPSQDEIDNFLKKGDLNGNGWGFFKHSNETQLKGIIIINPRSDEYASSYVSPDGLIQLVNALKSINNEYHEEN